MMWVESRGAPVPWRRTRHRRGPGTARQSASSARHTCGIAGHLHSRTVETRKPRPMTANRTFGVQIATAGGIRARSAAPSSEVITR